jgi:hypothetical protein
MDGWEGCQVLRSGGSSREERKQRRALDGCPVEAERGKEEGAGTGLVPSYGGGGCPTGTCCGEG